MKREVVATGKTVEEAIQSACKMLNADRDNVDVEILELPSKRLLGLLGASDAKVKVTVKETVEERAKNYLMEILSKMNLPNVTIETKETDGGILFDLKGEGLGVIIGHRGETLDAIQYLTSLVANRGEDEYKRITIDTGNYREKREKTLTSLARRIAQNAVKTRRSTTLEPMNPYERRIIHTAVQEVKGAASWSIGEDPNRRVVIGTEGGQKNWRGPRQH
ncbi:single-stranded nucleic acid binding R3H domain-containing protein [[Clostridium] cellulosi]|uniref:RNA-binding protein KhpB n=1 Tax=[Clostridium] cellulosi TaxID=29343 RepID=A0A078KRN0_9FIRM|nr:MAG: protein jag [[Clostridium] cellulosi]CDZ25167.1 single-stranded nucleic acid binding R3H domain-containing protein [[Clostridium] cellulosi]